MANSSYAGWGSSDQMTKQAITLDSYKGCGGSVFYGLASMKADPAAVSYTHLDVYKRQSYSSVKYTEAALKLAIAIAQGKEYAEPIYLPLTRVTVDNVAELDNWA